MTVTSLGEMTVGAALPATATAVAAINALVAASLAEVKAKLDGYALLAIPSPEFDIGAQVALAGSNYLEAVAELSALPGGAAVAATLTAAVAAQAAAQLAVKGLAPAIALKIDAALSTKAGLDVQVSGGVSGPNVNLTLIGEIAAELEGLKAMIEAKASLAAEISGALAAGGIRVLLFDGAAADFGAEIGAAVSGLGIPSFRTVVLVATTSGAWGGIQATLKTS